MLPRLRNFFFFACFLGSWRLTVSDRYGVGGSVEGGGARNKLGDIVELVIVTAAGKRDVAGEDYVISNDQSL